MEDSVRIPDEAKFGNSLFVFTRDLRIHDNTALLHACKQSLKVIPIFIISPRIVEGKEEKPSRRIQFLHECLCSLGKEFGERGSALHVFYGDYVTIIKEINSESKLDAVFMSHDFTEFAKKRRQKIAEFCSRNNIPLVECSDHLMYDPGLIKTKSGTPYTVFSQFFKAATQIPVSRPQKNEFVNFESKRFNEEMSELNEKLGAPEPGLAVHGGRKNGLEILQNIADFDNYPKEKDYPHLCGTTMLSAHNKFGTISVREVYYAIMGGLGGKHALMNQIHWREFFLHILFHFPQVTEEPFRRRYSGIRWSSQKGHFDAWKNGMTGFPIVDAGMRQLNQTGFMHNRVRMIVASFLVKDLHINWMWGERYFAEKLVDYDPAVNNGNWQWAASTGCDSQPWFRVFNPWLQQKKFDASCRYIQTWVRELAELEPRQIHSLDKLVHTTRTPYPRPIVDHYRESNAAKAIFRSCRNFQITPSP